MYLWVWVWVWVWIPHSSTHTQANLREGKAYLLQCLTLLRAHEAEYARSIHKLAEQARTIPATCTSNYRQATQAAHKLAWHGYHMWSSVCSVTCNAFLDVSMQDYSNYVCLSHICPQAEYERLLTAAFARGFLAGTPRAAKLLEACDKVMKNRHERSSAAEKQAAQLAEETQKRWSAIWQPEVDDVAVQSLKKALAEIDAATQQLRERDHALEDTLREHHQREAVSLMPVCNIAVKMRCAKVSECADDLLQQILHEVEVDGGEVEVEKVSIPALHRTVVRATRPNYERFMRKFSLFV